jgi:DNA-binding NarL/FixJ family response regulator
VRIYLVEDHPIFRHGLRDFIEDEEDMEVCGEAEEIGTAWNEILRLEPDLVLVDISLKGRNGLELVKSLSGWKKELPILVLSTHEESLYAERSIRAGARGYIMKHEATERIIKGLRAVFAGEIYVSPRIASLLLAKTVGKQSVPTLSCEETLSDRELEVFEFFGKGMTTKEISARLNLSPKTIATYRDRIKEKLGIKNSSELIRNAVQWLEGR